MNTTKSNAIIASKLTHTSLAALATNEIQAIRIKGFYPTGVAQEICSRMIDCPLYGNYENAPLIKRVGQALYESHSSNETRQRYWENATAWTQQLREICTPHLTPIDKLRLELDEAWSNGAIQGVIDDKKAFVGLARVFESGSLAEPHQDILSWDLPESETAKDLWAQLAANIYLRMPPKGGELTIWPCKLSPQEYKEIQNPKSYGVNRDKLPPPVATITPEEGELILFNSRLVHAVEPPERGARITWSCFIGLSRQANRPLIMWS